MAHAGISSEHLEREVENAISKSGVKIAMDSKLENGSLLHHNPEKHVRDMKQITRGETVETGTEAYKTTATYGDFGRVSSADGAS